MSDTQLWEQLKNGSHTAFRQIYETSIEGLLQYGFRFCKDKETVEDCLHDLFIYIWKNRSGLSGTDSIRRYLMVALRRRIIQELKVRSTDLNEQNMPFHCDLSMEEEWILSEEKQASQRSLQEAFGHLSERQKEAVYLKYYQGLSYEAICEVMNLNYQSARNLVFNSVQALRRAMALISLLIFLITI